MKNQETLKNEPGPKQQHLWLLQSCCLSMIAGGTPYRLIQNELTPAPIKPTFSTKDQDDANTLTQITEDLVALYIGHNPNLTSATMLVDSGASHSTMPISLSILRAPASLH